MAKHNNQKAKILFLQQILDTTEEGHPISMQEIIRRLTEQDIRAERKSIYDDMDVLRGFGLDITYQRERPSGYFVRHHKGQETEEKAMAGEVKDDEESPVFQEKGLGGWIITSSALAGKTGTQKVMKLSCTDEGREEARAYFGSSISETRISDEDYLLTVPLQNDTMFYGWLTAMNGKVRLQKPRKAIQAYREFLKDIARSYKSDGNKE